MNLWQRLLGWRRREAEMEPHPRPDLASANHRLQEAASQLHDERARAAALDRLAVESRVVRRRVDRFTAEMDGSFRRLGPHNG
jgi:hypothetical protein